MNTNVQYSLQFSIINELNSHENMREVTMPASSLAMHIPTMKYGSCY